MSDGAGSGDWEPAAGGDAPIRVLHVDDERDILDISSSWLERHEQFTVTTEQDPSAALDRLGDERIHCLVSDYDMPGMTGLELLSAVREEYPDLPFILYTGKGNEEIASEAISAGVTDYLQKEVGPEQFEVLANRITHAVTERRTETALRESERTLSTLMRNLPGMVYRCRNEQGWPMTFVSDGVVDLLGYGPAEITNGDVSFGEDVIHPEDREYVWTEVQDATSEGEPFKIEYRVWTEDGDQKWVWERGRVVDTAEDGTIVFEGVITDITERKEHEQQLRRAKQRYRRIAEQDLFGIYILQDEIIRYVNPKTAEMLGYEPEKIVGTSIYEFIPEERRESVRENIRDRMEGKADEMQYEIPTVRKDGSEFVAVVHGGVIEYEGDPALLGVLLDVTERKERERELEQYETMIDTVADGVYALDENFEFVTVNDGMVELTGYDRETLIGSEAKLLLDEAGARRSLENRRKLRESDREEITETVTIRCADGDHVPCEIRFRVLTDEDGQFRGTAGVVRDVTERQRRERELRRQNERLEQFAHLVSHDLKGPLSVAKARAEELALTGEDVHYEKLRTAHDRMEAIIDDVLDLARQGRTVREETPVELAAIAHDAWETVSGDAGTLDVRTGATVLADRSRLQSMLENVFRNAVEHGSTGSRPQADDTVEHGSTSNRTESGDSADHADSEVTVEVGVLPDEAGFYVADDGPGVPVGDREDAFDPGFSTDDDGTGFGLSIVETIAEAHGWQVFLTDAADGPADTAGAQFSVTGVGFAD